LQDLGVDATKIILTLFLRKGDVKMWTGIQMTKMLRHEVW